MESEIEKTGLRVNMGKTRIMVSDLDLDLLKKSGPCGVCQKGEGSNAISRGGCLFLLHKKWHGNKGPLAPCP